MFKIVAFDMDGTIANTINYCVDFAIFYYYNITTENCNNYQKSEVRRSGWSLSNEIYI